MNNFDIFVLTAVMYWLIWCAFTIDRDTGSDKTFAKSFKSFSFIAKLCIRFVIVALLCVPFNYNGNVITVIGNAKSDKNIFSFWSMYQNAKLNAVTVISTLSYQKSDGDSASVIGFPLYQEGHRLAFTTFGFPLYQKSDVSAALLVGIAGVQKSEGETFTGLGFAFKQIIPDDEKYFGIFQFGEPVEKITITPSVIVDDINY